MADAKILIIEDDYAIQNMYKLHFENIGYDVKTANDGQEGLSVARSWNPDLILLDIKMPIMNGDEMLFKLRESEKGEKPTKVIVLTNLSRSEAPRSLQFLGVKRYIVKVYYTPKQVMEIVKEVLGS